MARTRPITRRAAGRRTPYVAIADRPATTVSHPLIDLARGRGLEIRKRITTHGVPEVEIACKRGYVTLRPGSTVLQTANMVPPEMLDASDLAGLLAIVDGKANERSRQTHPAGWAVYNLPGPHLSVDPVAVAA